VIGKAARLGLTRRPSPLPKPRNRQARRLEVGQRILFREGGPSSRVRLLLITELLPERVRGHEWSPQLGRWLGGERSVPRPQLHGVLGARTKTETILARIERAAWTREARVLAAEAAYRAQLAHLAYPISAAD